MLANNLTGKLIKRPKKEKISITTKTGTKLYRNFCYIKITKKKNIFKF